MFAMPLAIFLLHNFMAQLPRDVMEAAKVDGANAFLTFRKIVLPLVDARRSRHSRSSSSCGCGTTCWSPDLRRRRSAGGVAADHPAGHTRRQLRLALGGATAAAFVAIVVPLIVFFALQRYFVRGLLAGSVKG